MNVFVRTAAREDILRQFAYYLDEKDAPRTARRFLDTVAYRGATSMELRQ